MARKKTAIIIGAGPAGLTAALEFIKKTDIKPIIFEASNDIGGISKTVNYKGNRIDIGGHRFFSKSDVVMDWWENVLPIQSHSSTDKKISLKYHGQSRNIIVKDRTNKKDGSRNVMLIRSRLSRIYHDGKFFDYPLTLNMRTIKNLGIYRLFRSGLSYLKAQAFPLQPEKTLEDFLINRFGRQLYLTFFKDYTEKVWGVECNEISADWGAQRIKGLSVNKVLKHAIKSQFFKNTSNKKDHRQKNTETSLIEQFLYPKYGPGQLWEVVARQIVNSGGEIHMQHKATDWLNASKTIYGVKIIDTKTNKSRTYKADYYFSTMPVKELIAGFQGDGVPARVKKVARGLMYRDFITVGLLIKKLNPATVLSANDKLIADNWIYVQERNVTVGRIQIFNNWSPYLVKNSQNIWIGLEYFVNEGDSLWSMNDKDLISFATAELVKLGFAEESDVIDGVVVRMPKAYPAYFGTYGQFSVIRNYIDKYENMFLIGRNGMHRYNNQDHSMLTAMQAVDNIRNSLVTKDNLWDINTEQQYHESKDKKGYTK